MEDLTLPCIQPRVLPGCRLASIASEQELDSWTAQISPQKFSINLTDSGPQPENVSLCLY